MKAVILIVILIACPTTAWAYVDPGSITMLLQIVSAFVVGSLLVFRDAMVGAVRALIRKIFPGRKRPPKDRSDGNKK